MTGLQKKFLVVEDDFLISAGLCAQIEDMGHLVCGAAASAGQAIGIAQEMQPDIILMDVRLDGDVDGVDAALMIERIAPSKIIFITGSKEPATMERIETAHPAAVLFKPFSSYMLQKAIDELGPE